MKLLLLFYVLLITIPSTLFAELQSLDDEEMSEAYGQTGILDINRFDYEGNNFYRIGANANIQTSVNVDRLTLRDGDGNIQIDVDDLSLSGGIDGAVSSASITNPFIEFAFAGDLSNDDITNRDFIGVRFGAEGLTGELSMGDPSRAGNTNSPDAGGENGLRSFRGYLQTNTITGTVYVADETRSSNISTTLPTCGGFVIGSTCIGVVINTPVSGSASFGTVDATTGDQIELALTASPVTLDSSQTTQQAAGGNIDSNGVITTAYILGDAAPTTVPRINGNATVTAVGFIPATPALTVNNLMISGEASSNSDPVTLFIAEDLRFLHRATATSSGGFLSFQNRDVTWRNFGRDDSDPDARGRSPTTAGWWMEFLDPVAIGELEIQDYSLPQNVIDGLATSVSNAIATQPPLSIVDALAALTSISIGPVDADLVADQNTGVPGIGNVNALSYNIPIANNQPIINCWNGSLGC